jgi:hypothetical protein
MLETTMTYVQQVLPFSSDVFAYRCIGCRGGGTIRMMVLHHHTESNSTLE